jgi:hypothetical protein
VRSDEPPVSQDTWAAEDIDEPEVWKLEDFEDMLPVSL